MLFVDAVFNMKFLRSIFLGQEFATDRALWHGLIILFLSRKINHNFFILQKSGEFFCRGATLYAVFLSKPAEKQAGFLRPVPKNTRNYTF